MAQLQLVRKPACTCIRLCTNFEPNSKIMLVGDSELSYSLRQIEFVMNSIQVVLFHEKHLLSYWCRINEKRVFFL